MTSAADMAIPRAPRLGKRILRLLLWTLAGIVVFFVLLFLASRTASDAVREIEAERATGLASTVSFARAQPFTLLRSVGNLQITRAASLLLKTRDFDSTRARMEAIVRSNKGYFDELQVGVREGSGHALTATFHVPVEQLDAALAQLKTLGHIEQESQASEESGSASDTLNAKLAAARVTEDRLNRLVREHSGRLGEYLEVEKEIATVRGEIEDLEAQQKKRALSVRYGAVHVTLKEEYAARFDVKLAALLAQFRSSIVDGLQRAILQGSAGLSLLFRYAPSLLFWVVLFYWPARWAWRRLLAFLSARNAPIMAH
ncbi:MAG: hypothetical protein DMG32_25020 [Acidobacteria bacterium]|nr:MAG: hypothetical protein DMG32_25020 [Acidobacteriota bacterium]